jgi:hypothetical protein
MNLSDSPGRPACPSRASGLVIPDHALGSPVLRTLSLCTCCRHYPGAAAGRIFRSFSQPYQPSPKTLSGRPAHRHFRDLLGVHSRYGLYTRAATVFRDTLSEGFSHFVTSMTAPVASGWSGRRVGLTPTGKRRLSTAHGFSCRAFRELARQLMTQSAISRPSIAALRKAYSITSSARADSVGGNSSPSAFAVLRLITNLKLVGSTTGRSAGFSPLRMRAA